MTPKAKVKIENLKAKKKTLKNKCKKLRSNLSKIANVSRKWSVRWEAADIVYNDVLAQIDDLEGDIESIKIFEQRKIEQKKRIAEEKKKAKLQNKHTECCKCTCHQHGQP